MSSAREEEEGVLYAQSWPSDLIFYLKQLTDVASTAEYFALFSQ